ncbi:hypothetical protein B0H13DRAFT_1852063 [Mycena leptocephala]|nr:hypothetical protein B0H13DRAFT_1852063 [Mycena leptocephala]
MFLPGREEASIYCRGSIQNHTLFLPNHQYIIQGLFAFNTEEEIIECNNVGVFILCILHDNDDPNPAALLLPSYVCQPRSPNSAAISSSDLRNREARMGRQAPLRPVLGIPRLLIKRDEADRLSGSRASHCFDLDVNEEPDEEPPAKAYKLLDAVIPVVYNAMPENNMPYLAFVAPEAIAAYSELTFDYNPLTEEK